MRDLFHQGMIGLWPMAKTDILHKITGCHADQQNISISDVNNNKNSYRTKNNL
jgi:hypothetical protein